MKTRVILAFVFVLSLSLVGPVSIAADPPASLPTPTLIESLDVRVSDPQSLAFDSRGTLYVVDGRGISKIDSEAGQTRITLPTDVLPMQIACDSADNIYVAGQFIESRSGTHNWIWKMTPDGQIRLFAYLEGGASDLTVGPDNNIYVVIGAQVGGNKLIRFDTQGNEQGSYLYPAMSSVTFDPAGNLFVGGPNGVFRVTQDGLPLSTYVSGAHMPNFGQKIRFDLDGWLFIDADYDLYVADKNGEVHILLGNVGQQESSMAFGPDNRLYLGDYSPTGSKILQISFDVADASAENSAPPESLHKSVFFFDSGQDLGSFGSMDVALGDLDGDGDLDAFVANYGPNKVFLNDGRGAFAVSSQWLGSSYSTGVALGDLDGDSDLDAVVSNFNRQPNSVWLNNGEGIFATTGQSLDGGYGEDVELGDMDGDHDLDAFITDEQDGATKLWLNNGNGVFTDSGQKIGGRYNSAAALGDLDGDSDLDVFVANYIGNPQTSMVWLNDGKGHLTDSHQSLGIDWRSQGIALGDLDKDGDLDAFLADIGASKVLLNNGKGKFSNSGQSLGDSYSSDVVLGDLDGDGDLDAFVTNGQRGSENQPDEVYLNDGQGRFTGTGQQVGQYYSWGVALGDVDGDIDLDAFVAEWYSEPGKPGPNKLWLNGSPPLSSLNPAASSRDNPAEKSETSGATAKAVPTTSIVDLPKAAPIISLDTPNATTPTNNDRRTEKPGLSIPWTVVAGATSGLVLAGLLSWGFSKRPKRDNNGR